MSERKIIGVDMGGTKIHTSLILGKEIIFECILDTPAKESEKVVLDRLIKAIEQVYQPGCEGIGIGVPSVVDWKEGIVYDVVAIPSWKEVHVKKYSRIILKFRYMSIMIRIVLRLAKISSAKELTLQILLE